MQNFFIKGEVSNLEDQPIYLQKIIHKFLKLQNTYAVICSKTNDNQDKVVLLTNNNYQDNKVYELLADNELSFKISYYSRTVDKFVFYLKPAYNLN